MTEINKTHRYTAVFPMWLWRQLNELLEKNERFETMIKLLKTLIRLGIDVFAMIQDPDVKLIRREIVDDQTNDTEITVLFY